MVRHAGLFSQLLSVINRQHFYELVYRHDAHRHSKGCRASLIMRQIRR